MRTHHLAGDDREAREADEGGAHRDAQRGTRRGADLGLLLPCAGTRMDREGVRQLPR